MIYRLYFLPVRQFLPASSACFRCFWRTFGEQIGCSQIHFYEHRGYGKIVAEWGEEMVLF
jgi:hypothetical protein